MIKRHFFPSNPINLAVWITSIVATPLSDQQNSPLVSLGIPVCDWTHTQPAAEVLLSIFPWLLSLYKNLTNWLFPSRDIDHQEEL